MTSAPPKVFISYSHDSVEHEELVLGFADRLRADGIDAELDQYNAAPPEGWPLWCERQIAAADFVLMICTETYHRRVSGEEERNKGLGVVWEARIIRQLLYDAGAISDKFVPVLFSRTSLDHIPTPIRGWTRYFIDTDDDYEELYRRLTSQPGLVKPDLGAIRPLPPRHRKWTNSQAPSTGASSPPEMATASDSEPRRGEMAGRKAHSTYHEPFRISSIPYLALWLMSVVSAFIAIKGNLQEELKFAQDLAHPLFLIICGIAFFIGIHMLFVYLSFHEIETNPETWKRDSEWVNERPERVLRAVIFISLLFVGGELCRFPVPIYYLCRPHIEWFNVLDVKEEAEKAKSCNADDADILLSVTAKLDALLPNEALKVSVPPIVSWCVVTFLLLLIWDIFDRRRQKCAVSQTLQTSGKYRILISDVIALAISASLWMLFAFKWRVVLFFVLFASGFIYCLMVLFRMWKYYKDGWKVVP